MLLSLNKKELDALRGIRNYYTHTGTMPSVRKLQNILGYKSPRSAAIIMEYLTKKQILSQDERGKYFFKTDVMPLSNGDNASTIDIPLLGSISCGVPIYAEENIEAMIPVSTKLVKSTEKYFILRAFGDSMNLKGIDDGDLILIKQRKSARTGELVVALVDNEATIKELRVNPNNIVLKPHSSNKRHFPIILTTDFRIQGVVESVIKL